jgi:GNAT superfamily N-acetyltransferase
MAVTTDVQGLGIGRKLMEHCIKPQRKTRSKKIIIYSNRRLIPAISLYEKFGSAVR